MPALAPVLRCLPESDGELVGDWVVVGREVLLAVVEVVEEKVDVDVGADVVNSPSIEVVDAAGREVGKWPFSHSIRPPSVIGSLPTFGMTGAAVKAAVIDSVAVGHSQRSPTLMVSGLPSSLQATLCLGHMWLVMSTHSGRLLAGKKNAYHWLGAQ